MRGGRCLVRMSDLVRGIHREGAEPPAREAPPAARPPAGPPPAAEAPPRVRFPTEPAAALAPPSPPEKEPTPPAEALSAEAEGAAGAEYLAAHMTSVGVLTMQIGRGLGYDRERLLDLGMAAFVFDVGIASLPAGADSAAYQTHAQLSAEIVRRWAPPRAGVVEAVLQHHERENGRGVPQRLAGGAIHPNAKTIGLMDTYTALIFPRPPGRRLPPHEAIREIVRSKHEDFATPLIKALLAEISVFPPRTVVRLNTGEVGRVIGVNRDHPLRPKVEVVADLKGNPLPTPKILDLSEAPFIYVTGPVEEEGR